MPRSSLLLKLVEELLVGTLASTPEQRAKVRADLAARVRAKAELDALARDMRRRNERLEQWERDVAAGIRDRSELAREWVDMRREAAAILPSLPARVAQLQKEIDDGPP